MHACLPIHTLLHWVFLSVHNFQESVVHIQIIITRVPAQNVLPLDFNFTSSSEEV